MRESHLWGSGYHFPASPLRHVLPLSLVTPLIPAPSHSSSSFGSFVPGDPTPISCLGLHVRGGKKKKEKNFIRYFPEERGLHPLNLCHMATNEGQPLGPVTNSVVPRALPCRVSPAGTTSAKVSLQQHPCVADKAPGHLSYPFGSTSWASCSLVLISFLP